MFVFRSSILILVALSTSHFDVTMGNQHNEYSSTVNCGSAIKLYHTDNPTYFLNSDAFSWGSGSKQQVVTLKDGKEEGSQSSSLWQVQEAHGKKPCETGTPIRCGETVRLLNMKTKKRLHTHSVPSSLTPNRQEVSAFGDTGQYGVDGGDKSDDWTILCSSPYWNIGQNIRLYHEATHAHLESSSGRKFTSQNCPRCPILGELEVSTSKRATTRLNFFRVDEQGAHVYKL